MSKQRSRVRQLGGALALCVCALALDRWTPLHRIAWWYPQAAFFELWWIWWGVLFVGGALWQRRDPKARPWILGLWLLTLVFAISGFWNLLFYIQHKFTVGDLHTNHFLGAQRASKGLPIYDLQGLRQSVNASPFVIALLRPFGHLSTRAFLPYWLVANALLFGVFLLYSWLWVRKIWARVERVPGLPMFGLLFVTCVYFNSFQRSWRLGQLDILVMALVMAGTYHMAQLFASQSQTQGFLGAFLLALAVGVKIVPGLLCAPLLLWLACHPKEAWSRRHSIGAVVAGGLVGLALVAVVAVAGVGSKEIGRFAQNISKMGQGSTLGVNYAVVARFAKYRDPKARLRHQPIPAQDLRWLWPLRALVLLLWGLLAWRLGWSQLPWLMWCGLASLPLLSAMCWDIYFLWCSNAIWFLLLAWLVARSPQLPLREGRQIHPLWLRFGFESALLIAAYYMIGLAGNSTMRDLWSGALMNLELPMWFDEQRMLGLALFWLLFIRVLWRMTPASSET